MRVRNTKDRKLENYSTCILYQYSEARSTFIFLYKSTGKMQVQENPKNRLYPYSVYRKSTNLNTGTVYSPISMKYIKNVKLSLKKTQKIPKKILTATS